MKSILKILLLCFSITSFAQAPPPADDFYVSPELQETLESIADRGEVFGKDFIASLKVKGLTSIEVVDDLPDGAIGYFERSGNSFKVTIHRICLEDPVSLEWTLAHELGHGLDMEPIITYLPDGVTKAWSTEIMAEDGVIDPSHIVYQIMANPKYSPKIWENYFKGV